MEIKTYFSQSPETNKASKFYNRKNNDHDLFVFITLLGSDGFNAHTTASILWEKIKDILDHPETSQITENVTTALKKARQQLIMLIRNDPEFSDLGIDMHLTIIILRNGALYIGNLGDNDIFIIRDQPINLAKLIFASEKIFQTGSGEIQDGDILLVSSPNTAAAYIETQDTFSSSSQQNIKTLRSDLSALVNDFTGNQTIATLFLTPKTKEDVEATNKLPGDVDNGTFLDTAKAGIVKLGEKATPYWQKTKQFFLDTYTKYKPIVINFFHKSPSTSVTKDLTEKSIDNQVVVNPPSNNNPIQSEQREGTTFFKSYEIKKGITQDSHTNVRKTPIQRKIMSLVSKFPIKTKFGPRKLRTNIKVPLYRRKEFLVGIIAIVLILFVGSFFRSNINKKNYNEKYTTIKETLKTLSESVNSLKSQIDSSSYEYAGVSEEINNLYYDLQNFEVKDLNETDKQSIETQLSELKSALTLVNNKINVITPVREDTNLESYIDTQLACSGESNPLDFDISDQYILVVGGDNNYACAINLNTREGTILDKDRNIIVKPYAVTAHKDGFYILDEKKGLINVTTQIDGQTISNPSLFEVKALLNLTNTTIGETQEVAIYDIDPTKPENIYFLNVVQGRIRKTSYESSGFIFPETYIIEDQLVHGVDIMIDGDIYIISNTSDKILKFFAGKFDNLTVEGAFPDLARAGKGYTSEFTHNLYVIDYQEDYQRIVVYEKPYRESVYHEDGTNETLEHHIGELQFLYQLQYQGNKENSFSNLKDITVDALDSTMWVLDDSIIQKISL